MTDAYYMAHAIAKAREGIERGQTPFGACIVRDGAILALEHNAVWAELDITAHAEIRAIRRACRKLGTIDLSGTVIYSTCEPCPMCFSAIHWAKIDKIVFGARIADAKALGFSELEVSNETLKRLGPSPVEIRGDYRREECLELFRLWSQLPNRLTY
jgi:tRNA(Arg) A34 adenosine deaminase TadA